MANLLQMIHIMVKTSKILVKIVIIFLFLIEKNNSSSYISFAIGSTLPFLVGLNGADIIASIRSYEPASEQLLAHIKDTFGSNPFESVYVGEMNFFGAYVPNYKTLILGNRYNKNPSLLTAELIEHEYAHSKRYSTEKIRFCCIVIPFVTFYIMQFLFKKLTKSKHHRIHSMCTRINKLNPWIKSLLFGFGLFLINQHILAGFARWEEWMTDRTADMLFNKKHENGYDYDRPKSILDFLKIILFPSFFWNHPKKFC